MEKEPSYEDKFYELARDLSLGKQVLACCLEYEKPMSLIEKAQIEIEVTERDIDDLLDSYNKKR